jgi:hypothetical protein
MELRAMTTMPGFDVMELLPAVTIGLGAAFVWMFWELEQRPGHRHKSQLRWAQLTAISQKNGVRNGIARR